jgi:hypothetical protein
VVPPTTGDYTSGEAIEVCASFGNSARVSALFEAELSECIMNENICGLSTGAGSAAGVRR